MKKIVIEFLLTSLDSKASFITSGEIEGNKLSFQDPENNLHNVIINKESIEYFKTGSVYMKYVYSLDVETQGVYEVEGNRFEFDIRTLILEINENKIEIKYDLLQDNELVNQSTLLIKYI